jgi:hypothetical protein
VQGRGRHRIVDGIKSHQALESHLSRLHGQAAARSPDFREGRRYAQVPQRPVDRVAARGVLVTTLRQAPYKFTPVGKRLSIRDTASHLGLRGPISCRDLIRRLKPQYYNADSGDLGPSTITGRAQLVLFSDGFWTYRGHVHESGAIGHDYAFATVINYRGPDGKAYAFANSDTVHGLDVGSRDSDWQQDGWDQRISAQWDAIASSSWKADLHVSTDAAAVVELILAGLGLAAVGVGAAIFVGDPNTHCHPRGFQDDSGGSGIKVICERQ